MASFPQSRTRTWWEISIVLALGLGQSAVYAVVALLYRLSAQTALKDQVATLNPARSDQAVFDLVYQLLAVAFGLAPVALVFFLMWQNSRPHLGAIGLDGTGVLQDTGRGAGLVLLIGIPGLVLYFVGRSLGMFVAVDPGSQSPYWWSIPVLLLSAARASLSEEVVVLGYLFARLRGLGWGPMTIVIATSVLRATYHLYQGPGAFVGNLAMGLIFGWLFLRSGRLLPFLVAHFLIDAAVFVGYPWVAATFPALFN